jgi:catechol 2,3-dioxygenase
VSNRERKEHAIMTDQTITRPQLHHLNLTTTRLQAMIDWYGLVLGLTPNFAFPGGAFLTNDAANHRLALLVWPDAVAEGHTQGQMGLHHHAFEYAALADLLAAYVRLKGHGIVPAFALDHGMTVSLYYPDPDGNLLALQVDSFGDWAASTHWMQTAPAFAANPIGTQFTPDKLVAALAAAEDPATVHQRAYAGEYAPGHPAHLGL